MSCGQNRNWITTFYKFTKTRWLPAMEWFTVIYITKTRWLPAMDWFTVISDKVSWTGVSCFILVHLVYFRTSCVMKTLQGILIEW